MRVAIEYKRVRELLECKLENAKRCTVACVKQHQQDMAEQKEQALEERKARQEAASQLTAHLRSVQAASERERQIWALEKEAMECVKATMAEDADEHTALQADMRRAQQHVQQLSERAAAAEEEMKKSREIHTRELQFVRAEQQAQRTDDTAMRADIRQQVEMEHSQHRAEQQQQHDQQMAAVKQTSEQAEQQRRAESVSFTQHVQRLESELRQQTDAAILQTQQHAELFFQQEKRMGSELTQCQTELAAQQARNQQLMSLMTEWLDGQQRGTEEKRHQLKALRVSPPQLD